jgi:phage virion morphogenesis protein
MIDVDLSGDQQILQAMEAMIARGRSLQPAMQDIGELMIESTRQRFTSKQGPDGSPWPNKNNLPDLLVGESKTLRRDFSYRARGDSLVMGTNVRYARTHQEGAARGAFRSSSSGMPLPWGDIPARPFMGFSDDDRANIRQILEDHIRGDL